MDNIELNFLPLTAQDFWVTVYRRKSDKTNEKSETGSRFFLEPNDSHIKEAFDVSWEPRDGFVKYTCPATECLHLTKQYLFRSLEAKLQQDCSVEFYSPTRSFNKELRFIVNRVKEGQTELCLQPYFLDFHRQFGFLVQHHFRVNQGQPFNCEVQKHSLSLDNRYQQNRSFYSDKYRITQTFISNVVSQVGNIFDDVSISTKLADIQTDSMKTKQYIVRNGRQSNSQYGGIKQNGPFELVADQVKYLFVFTEPLRSLARDVYSGLEGKLFSGMFSGLYSMFKLPFDKTRVDHLLIEEYDTNSIETIVSAN